MHLASKIKRSRDFSVSPSRNEGLSTPKAPARLCSSHLPGTSHCFWNQAHWGQLSSIFWGGEGWCFTTFLPNVSERERWSCTTLLCLALQRNFPWSHGRASVLMLCFQPGLNQKCPWCILYTSTPAPEHPVGDLSTSSQHIRGSSRSADGLDLSSKSWLGRNCCIPMQKCVALGVFLLIFSSVWAGQN